MIDFDCLADYDIFLNGEWFTCLHGMTYDEVLDWTWPIVRDHPNCDLDIRLKVDGD